jgi:hypothetical protein
MGREGHVACIGNLHIFVGKPHKRQFKKTEALFKKMKIQWLLGYSRDEMTHDKAKDGLFE